MENRQQKLDKQLPNEVSQFGPPLAAIEPIFHEEGGIQNDLK